MNISIYFRSNPSVKNESCWRGYFSDLNCFSSCSQLSDSVNNLQLKKAMKHFWVDSVAYSLQTKALQSDLEVFKSRNTNKYSLHAALVIHISE